MNCPKCNKVIRSQIPVCQNCGWKSEKMENKKNILKDSNANILDKLSADDKVKAFEDFIEKNKGMAFHSKGVTLIKSLKLGNDVKERFLKIISSDLDKNMELGIAEGKSKEEVTKDKEKYLEAVKKDMGY